MSRRFHVFVDTKLNLADFAKDFAKITDLELSQKSDEYGSYYESIQSNFLLDLGPHDFDNDRNMNFEAYKYDVRLTPFGVVTNDAWNNFLDSVVKPLYQEIKATGNFSVMLVDDLQVKLEEFSPQLSALR